MKKIFLWGTGKVASDVLKDCTTLNQYDILGVIDNDSKKWGNIFGEYMIYAPDILIKFHGITVVILSNFYDEIKAQVEMQYSDFVSYIENKNFFYKEILLNRYENNRDSEIMEVVSNIKECGLNIFNYKFVEKYKNKAEVSVDENNGFYYLMHNGKKMYYPNTFKSKETVVEYYNSILLEQDYNSPHRYLSDDFNVVDGDVVVDIGAAEGNFAIEIIDKVSKLYLIETSDEWIEALKLTFRKYKEKVVIIKAFVSSYCDENMTTIDSLIQAPVNFIKMDIEGNEWDALMGAEKLIERSKGLKLAICSYHSDFDQELIESFMDKHFIAHRTSKGYMWFPYKLRQTYISTKLNRGIVFGMKE